MSHGGYREGAGRKKTSRFTETVCWRVTPEAKDWLMRAASERGVPVGAVLEELIRMQNYRTRNEQVSNK